MVADKSIYIQIGNDDYQVRKFNSMTGLRIARLVIAKLMPIVPALGGGGGGDNDGAISIDIALDKLGEALSNITDTELENLSIDCLKHCSKKLGSGYVPILDEKGRYRIPEAEYDAPLTLRLMLEAIKYGAMDFFDGSNPALAGLANSITSLLNQ